MKYDNINDNEILSMVADNEDATETLFSKYKPLIIGIALSIMGILLYIVDKKAKSKTNYEDMNFKQTFLIGLSQSLAFIPGVSRSGVTMTVGRMLGVKREAAARYSFMLSAPIVLAATIYKLIGALQPEKYHPEGDAYNHTMICVDKSCEYTSDLKIRFSVLVHDLGKGETKKQEYPHHYGHEERGVEIVKKFSDDLGVPNAWKKCGIVAAREHMRGGIFNRMKPSKKVEFIERIDKSYLGLDGLQIVVNCDKGGRTEDDLDFLSIGKKCLSSVTASDIAKKYNLKPGMLLGRKLHEERIIWMKNLTK